MPLTIWNCVWSYWQKDNFPEITFITEFLDSKFLLPTIYTGSKCDLQVANLLLATVHFEPCINCKNSKYWKSL